MQNGPPERHEILKGVPFFSDLGGAALDQLLENSRTLRLRKNTILMSEGETGESMYIVCSGTVKIFVSDEGGHEIVLYIEGPGSHIGEISLLDDEPRTASVMTLEQTDVLAIPKADFVSCLEQNPAVALSIIRSMTLCLRRATDTIRSLALDNVYQRLVSKFSQIAVVEDGVQCLPRRFTNQELGDMIGASREMVGKIVKDLERGGYIEQTDRRWCLRKELPDNW